MKVLILGFSKIKYMPYANFYLNNLNKNKNSIHLLYWNRDQKEEDLSMLEGISLHEFSYQQKDEVVRLSKVKSFLAYRKYARKKIKELKPDFIIVLHTLPAVLIVQELKKYKGNFIFDYRDSTYEKFLPFRAIVHRIVRYSKYTFVSSDAFRRFLPKSQTEKIFTSHNLLEEDLKHKSDRVLYGVPSKKIRIAFWGFIRHEEINKQVINRMAKDSRFELHYYGREQQTALNLKKYVKENNITNVFFHGEYKPQDRYEFIKNTDIIHNVYCDSNMMLAMSNKYYDGIIFQIPQICMPNSFMGEKVVQAGVGIVCDPRDENFTEKIFNYYIHLNHDQLMHFFQCELKKIKGEYDDSCQLLRTI